MKLTAAEKELLNKLLKERMYKLIYSINWEDAKAEAEIELIVDLRNKLKEK